MPMVKEKFSVGGMHCGACATGIQMYLSNTEGVKGSSVDYDKKVAEVEYDNDKIKQEGVIKAIEEVGFTAQPAAS